MAEILMVENFIGGDFISSAKHIDSFNPATGEVWALIPDSGAHQVNEAVAAAEKAFPSWSRLTPSARAKYLLNIADIIDQRLDELSLAESMDQGKPVWLAKQMDIPRASHNFRSFAESWQHLTESSNSMSGAGVINYSLRKPLGVAGNNSNYINDINPWNLPLYLLTFKIAPALMAGNTVVCKTSEMTSVTAWKLAQICKQVELPPGVLNMVFGYGQTAGEALVTHPKVRIVSFTGSTAVGQHIGRIAAPMMKKLSLELGGKNAAVVFDDADLEKCAQGLVRSAFLNQGEICLCTSRVFIQKGVYNKVLERFIQLTNIL
ncbi:aldehyde dehydrogenase family 8 member A1 isoform X2 [Eurytemora carolleeae]|uniref:aldehyde dehydrogenase family 8 member A1 isoform X2 n=1 Tax=Eurytemora carolleeae TaxID=1294199 RepID=UPI000C78D3D3|nr:aldehyde dehydrogenase family 8 member A1 isoform X2 [Eurytemora carolleeae]|eukprot:XP_023344685.1 aldehyde dehydrogenase family 8 member A1-like isoform X2 [Eurytemora affinis]